MKKRDILLFLFSTSILVFAWIGFSVYHNFVSSTITPSQGIQIAPIDPNFDTKTIENLKKRKQITPLLELSEKQATKEALVETPTVTGTESATQGGIKTP